MCCAKGPSRRPSSSDLRHFARARIQDVTTPFTTMTFRALDHEDPDVADLIRKEYKRQSETLELIASENLPSPAVLEALGTLLTNNYAEGYPDRLYYAGPPHALDHLTTPAVHPTP